VADPPPWPERPENAQDFDTFWLVRGLPPEPFPLEDYPYWEEPAVFGPPGTRWVYPISELIDREAAPGTASAVKAAAGRLLALLKTKSPPAGSAGWEVPGTAPAVPQTPQEAPVPMLWIRTQIVAALSTDEEVVHVHNWRHSTQENAPLDATTVKIVGNAVRNGFAQFLSTQGAKFPTALQYKEVRASALTQVNPGEDPEWPLPTQVSPFAANTGGTASDITLPYEVACCLTLNTNTRGTSRFRGRTYLGPFSAGMMGSNGNFDPTKVNALATAFGTDVIASVEASTDYELHVISQKYGTSAKVTGVKVGQVPDSQRRRRRDRVENYYQAWGSPVGAL